VLKEDNLISWDGETPFSTVYDDIYYSKGSGVEEVEHVFLQPNRIRERFLEGETSIGELGFGTGLSFLVTWDVWIECGKKSPLNFYSVEKYPIDAKEFERIDGHWPDLKSLSSLLRLETSELEEGWNKFSFEDSSICLHLWVGDVNDFLNEMKKQSKKIDSWYLDGFSPSKNPEMWVGDVMSLVADCSIEGTTFSTFTSVGQVKRNLRQAGFQVEKIPGFGKKRDMLAGEKQSG